LKLKLLLIAALAITALAAPAAASARTYGLGLKVSQNAERHPARLAGLLATLPASYSLQQYAPIPGDQGDVGSCAAWGTAYTAMGVLENMDQYQGFWDNPFNSLPGGGGSAMYVYSQTCGGVDQGSRIDDDVAIETSQGDDEDADYAQGELDYWDWPTAQETANAQNWLLATGQDIGTDQYSIEQAISNNEPVVIGIEVTQAFQHNTSGNYPDPYNSYDDWTSLGGHAPAAVGYDSDGLIVENSWGPSWDNGGYVHISWDWLESTNQDSTYPDLTQAVAMVAMTHVAPALTLTSLNPTSGPVGTVVTIGGSDLTGATAVTFNGLAAATLGVLSDTQLKATVPAGATSGPITVTTPGGTATSTTSFTVTAPAPTLTRLTPTSGPVGTVVTIGGSDLTGATAVTFNGLAAARLAVLSDTQLKATVPAGATSGPITVTTPGGTVTSTTRFIVTARAPKIGKLSLTSGKRGATVTITGKAFGSKRGAGTVKFGAKAVTRYLSWSTTRIRCRVPAKAKFGKLKVTVKTKAGTSNAKAFRVKR
jgi:hypothetical protein